jgi:hypothetical protein
MDAPVQHFVKQGSCGADLCLAAEGLGEDTVGVGVGSHVQGSEAVEAGEWHGDVTGSGGGIDEEVVGNEDERRREGEPRRDQAEEVES